jgi:hypothetical protein
VVRWYGSVPFRVCSWRGGQRCTPHLVAEGGGPICG